MLLCSLNVVARCVLAAYRAEKAGLFDEAAAACDAEGKDTRSPSAIKDWQSRDSASSENREKSLFATRFLEAFVLVMMAFSFQLFFPACLVMFRRVERKLDSIIQEMSLRSDIGSVFLPFEFSAAAADGTKTQVWSSLRAMRLHIQLMFRRSCQSSKQGLFSAASDRQPQPKAEGF